MQKEADRVATEMVTMQIEQVLATNNHLVILGNSRFGQDFWHLPTDEMLGFHLIQTGKFSMGSVPDNDKQAFDDEQPQHELDVPSDFYLALYPFTVAQSELFFERTGYEMPVDEHSLRGVLNHPVVFVTR